jgi:23S rRNA (cytidine2498-2'-O)-methyltransferase
MASAIVQRNNISWMVCDMVEKPAKVAALMAQWLVNGWCRETIFNLKLPMKKRYEELSQNLAYIQEQLDEHGLMPRSRRASCITTVKR